MPGFDGLPGAIRVVIANPPITRSNAHRLTTLRRQTGRPCGYNTCSACPNAPSPAIVERGIDESADIGTGHRAADRMVGGTVEHMLEKRRRRACRSGRPGRLLPSRGSAPRQCRCSDCYRHCARAPSRRSRPRYGGGPVRTGAVVGQCRRGRPACARDTTGRRAPCATSRQRRTQPSRPAAEFDPVRRCSRRAATRSFSRCTAA